MILLSKKTYWKSMSLTFRGSMSKIKESSCASRHILGQRVSGRVPDGLGATDHEPSVMVRYKSRTSMLRCMFGEVRDNCF